MIEVCNNIDKEDKITNLDELDLKLDDMDYIRI